MTASFTECAGDYVSTTEMCWDGGLLLSYFEHIFCPYLVLAHGMNVFMFLGETNLVDANFTVDRLPCKEARFAVFA